MKKRSLSVFGIALLAVFGMARASASPQQSAQSQDKTPPSYDMKAQAMQDLEGMNQKFVSLAQAIPQDKFTWRPSPDARSFAEVFLHVAAERYQILALKGTAAPAGIDLKGFEKSTTDKAKIVEELNKSWDFTHTTIQSMANADFAKALPKLGPDANEGDVVYILVSDAHEHLGQSIAYARVNDIVPPWTVAAKKAAEKAAVEKKANQ